MDNAVLAAQTALASVFLVSGLAKALDHAGTRQALREFRVPDRIAPVLAPLLPLAELSTALLLLLRPTARFGGAAGLVLLSGFTIAIAHALQAGRAPQCRCFGALGLGRVSGRTLLRNGLFTNVPPTWAHDDEAAPR